MSLPRHISFIIQQYVSNMHDNTIFSSQTEFEQLKQTSMHYAPFRGTNPKHILNYGNQCSQHIEVQTSNLYFLIVIYLCFLTHCCLQTHIKAFSECQNTNCQMQFSANASRQ